MHCGEDDADYLNNPELGVKRQGLHVLWQGPAEKPRLQGFKLGSLPSTLEFASLDSSLVTEF